ncbi:ester cyclase [Streptosporangium sp. NPDC001681]|uniref:ester cyclase n=1 Tax=Streptosporangium sp. NPDC001681 TaxID=3154395 RepID=UPI0033312B42
MDMRQIAESHLKAWQSGDAEAVAASVDAFDDPDTAGPLSGDALAAHAGEVLARFGNLRLHVEHLAVTEEFAMLSWTLEADHRAPYLAMPAVGRPIRVTGTDLLVRDGETVRVQRCFDRLAVAAALGFEARFVPEADEEREFGVSTRTTLGRTARPGALALTWLEVDDGAQAAEVDLLSVEVVKALRASKGFLGASTFDIGRRKFTLSAFDRPESVRAVHGRPHQRAMRRFFKGGLCTRALTSIWLPATVREYARCPDCETVFSTDEGAACGCGWIPERESLL